jgi:hypothetical protein
VWVNCQECNGIGARRTNSHGYCLCLYGQGKRILEERSGEWEDMEMNSVDGDSLEGNDGSEEEKEDELGSGPPPKKRVREEEEIL